LQVGIALSLIALATIVYEVSVAHRTGGWKGRLAALERDSSPFAT